MRIFSIGQWYHFAYLIISIAMLGMALSGSAAALINVYIDKFSDSWFYYLAFLFAPGLWLSYEISQRIPFESIEIVAESGQWFYAGLLYLVLALPFMVTAGFVTLTFMNYSSKTGFIYGINLGGSGVGAFAVTILMYWLEPASIIYGLIFVAALAGFFVFHRRVKLTVLLVLFLAAVSAQLLWFGPTPIYVSEYKPISYARQLPDLSKQARRVDPLAVVEVLRSTQFRETTGQLSNYPYSELGPLPEQAGLFFDGMGPEAVHKFTGDLSEFQFFDYLPGAAGYIAADTDSLLLLGAGGGSEVLAALYHGFRDITAVEVNPSVQRLLADELYDFSGAIIDHPNVDWIHAEPRSYARRVKDKYSLVHVLPAGGIGAGLSMRGLNENYHLTVEAVMSYIKRLDAKGVLAFTRPVSSPPRDIIRTAATVLESARRLGLNQPAEHLILLRSWNAGMVLFFAEPPAQSSVARLQNFAESRWFDLDYFPGIEPGYSPRFILTDPPTHAELIKQLIESPQQLYQNYEYNIRPVTDHQPYFNQFFRYRRLGELLGQFDLQRYPHSEWGFFLVLITLIQAVVVGTVIMFVPLLFKKVRRSSEHIITTAIYFTCLGFGYMAIEIGLIQQMMLILHYPVYSVAVILAGLLMYSGLGSYTADKTGLKLRKRVVFAVAGIIVSLVVLHFVKSAAFTLSGGWPDSARIVLVLIMIAPLGFCMGIPFPSGLRAVGSRGGTPQVAWAWAVNGATSIIGSVLAGLVALTFGFPVLFLFGAALYMLALVCFLRLSL